MSLHFGKWRPWVKNENVKMLTFREKLYNKSREVAWVAGLCGHHKAEI